MRLKSKFATLKTEACKSYANEPVISVQNENKDFQQKSQELESRHIIFKQEANSLREENKSLLTDIRLMNKELQNSNEEKCFPTIAPNLHDQLSEGVNAVLLVHNKESSWVTVDNEKSKHWSKRKRSKKAKLLTNANPAESSRRTIERNQTIHQQRRTSIAAQQTQNPFNSDSSGNPTTDPTGKKKKKLVIIAWDSIIQYVRGWHLSTNHWACGSQVLLVCSKIRYALA